MQITVKEKSGLSHSFHVVVPAAQVAQQLEKELQSVGRKVKIPGFRAGKVPMNVLKHKYSKEVMGDVLQNTVEQATRDVIEKNKLHPAIQPDVKIVSFEEGADLAFDIALEVMPQVPEIDFSRITVDELTYELPEAEVEKGLENLAKSREHTHLHDGAAEMGNVVKIDFLGKKDGIAFAGGEGKGFQLQLGSGQFIPGFEEKLLGVKAGDERSINLTFPTEYHSKDLAGKAVTFDVHVHEVLRLHAPDIDDKLAESMGFSDLDNMRRALRQQIDAGYKSAARTKEKKQLFDALDEIINFEIPAGMLKLEMDSVMKQVDAAKKAGDPELKDRADDDIHSEYTLISERRVRLGILLSDVARRNNLQISREDLSAAVMSQARQYQGQEDKVFDFYRKNPARIEDLRGPIIEDKSVDFILSRVTRKLKPVSIGQLMSDDDETVPPKKKAKKK